MDSVLVTLYCPARDAEGIVAAARKVSPEPIHVRNEAVDDRDFGTALTAEQVAGQLQRVAIEVTMPRIEADALIASLADVRRSAPVRWTMMPVIMQGCVP